MKSKPKTYTQKLFHGIAVNEDPIDISNNSSVSAYNIDIQIIGELKNTNGSVKKITTGLGAAVDCLIQVNNYNIALYGGTYGWFT